MPSKREASPIGQRLQRVRGMTDLSARELDRIADITEGHTSLIESGVVENVSAATAAKLARALGVQLEWFVTGEGKEPSERGVRAAVEDARSELAKTNSKPAA